MNYKKLVIYRILLSIYVTFSFSFLLASVIILLYPNKYHYVYIQKMVTQPDTTCSAYISEIFNSSNYTIITLDCSYSDYVGKSKTIRVCSGLLNKNLQEYCSCIPLNYSILMVFGAIVIVISSCIMIIKYKIELQNYHLIILSHQSHREERMRQRRQTFYIQRPLQAEVIDNHFEIPIREISKLEPNQTIGTAADGHIVKILNP